MRADARKDDDHLPGTTERTWNPASRSSGPPAEKRPITRLSKVPGDASFPALDNERMIRIAILND